MFEQAVKATDAVLEAKKHDYILDQPCRWEKWAATKRSTEL
jgi:hypothetical protein